MTAEWGLLVAIGAVILGWLWIMLSVIRAGPEAIERWGEALYESDRWDPPP